MQTLKIPPICWLLLSIITGVIYVIGLSVYPSLAYSYFYRRTITVTYFMFFFLWTPNIGLLPHNRTVSMNKIMLFSLILLFTSGVIAGMVFLLKDIPNLIEPKISFLYIGIDIAVVIASYILILLLDISAQYSIECAVVHEWHAFLSYCMMGYAMLIVQISRLQLWLAGILLLKSLLAIFRVWLMRWLGD